IVWPAAIVFRFEAVGRDSPAGHTVTKPGFVACVAVTFSTTAIAPVAGTPPWPATWRSIVPLAGTLPAVTPMELRVSRMRVGVSGGRGGRGRRGVAGVGDRGERDVGAAAAGDRRVGAGERTVVRVDAEVVVGFVDDAEAVDHGVEVDAIGAAAQRGERRRADQR